jgi:hypothetical protein
MISTTLFKKVLRTELLWIVDGTKNCKFLGAGGVAQVEEHLPSNCEAPSSNPSIAKKKKYCLPDTSGSRL